MSTPDDALIQPALLSFNTSQTSTSVSVTFGLSASSATINFVASDATRFTAPSPLALMLSPLGQPSLRCCLVLTVFCTTATLSATTPSTTVLSGAPAVITVALSGAVPAPVTVTATLTPSAGGGLLLVFALLLFVLNCVFAVVVQRCNTRSRRSRCKLRRRKRLVSLLRSPVAKVSLFPCMFVFP